ncbi:GNAT family N-acetyltransferase [Aeromonas cavernicola]|uniref:GNAT family N-acetyltransferase n=1 Tax=Aeromonas cavernicola TaxID=1006623 RepID=A0A2H9U8Y3_9GAMM|nr:GNAT family N-acetyltransferase [Aeromonas cavernicola]PJG60500.1 GNAT family N-acetyltransferase [Aeromonas cavernicola]
MDIVEVDSTQGIKPALITLLQDCVASGASVGFLPPLAEAVALEYWQGIEAELAAGSRRLWVAFEQHQLVGTLQLALCGKANGRHRAEVEKLMVHSQARGKGVGRALMATMEQGARDAGRTLLVLDTRVGDVASTLYRHLGYLEAGQIPDFARSANGSLAATLFFYKQL